MVDVSLRWVRLAVSLGGRHGEWLGGVIVPALVLLWEAVEALRVGGKMVGHNNIIR